MRDFFISLFAVIIIFVFAVWILIKRDLYRRKRHEESRTVQERIDEIQESALQWIEVLSGKLEMGEFRGDAEKEHLFWIEPVVEYSRRLEALASNDDARAEDAYALSEEANEYLREHKIKGVPVGMFAKTLGDLLEQREEGLEE